MTDRFDQYESDLEQQPSFDEALEELKTETDSMPSPALIAGLSDLSQAQLAQLEPVWEGLSADYQRLLTQMLVDAATSNFRLNFRPIGFATLRASQPAVRQAAIELLAEDESTGLLENLIHLLQTDPVPEVRAEAARALGRFVLLGETGDLDDEQAERIQSLLIATINNPQEDLQVKRLAIEAIANCTRKEVPAIIHNAYQHADPNMRLSAVTAMGHTCDDRWENDILDQLTSFDDEMRLAAIRSAGELQLTSATQAIIKNIEQGDREEQEIAIWSLGEIGGKEALRVLESLLEGAENADDPDLIDLIDEALANASLVNGDFMLVDFSDLDIDD
ncbi:MAG: HEAT repeat domain-containing protein [Anaerolineae bacterium]